MKQTRGGFRVLKFMVLTAFLSLLLLSPVKAAEQAMFSFSSDKTQYKVGDEGTITCSVDAGPYASTLNVIDMDINISDTSVIEVKNSSSPFTAGSIFSIVGMQSLKGNTVNVVTYINPSNKPGSRSGTIGTMQIKALKTGQATLKYDRIEAAEEGKENEWATTAASSLVVNVADAGASATATPAASTGGGSTDTSAISSQSGTSDATASTGATATAKSTAKSTASSATTGPESLLVVLILGSMAMFMGYKILNKSARKI